MEIKHQQPKRVKTHLHQAARYQLQLRKLLFPFQQNQILVKRRKPRLKLRLQLFRRFKRHLLNQRLLKNQNPQVFHQLIQLVLQRLQPHHPPLSHKAHHPPLQRHQQVPLLHNKIHPRLQLKSPTLLPEQNVRKRDSWRILQIARNSIAVSIVAVVWPNMNLPVALEPLGMNSFRHATMRIKFRDAIAVSPAVH